MDDLSFNSQMPEVVWDCGSPSPNAWKKCQDNSTSNSVEKSDYKLQTTVLQKQFIKKPRNIFTIDTKSLDKAHSIIAQLNSGKKGGQEELASSLSTFPISNGNVIEDFWSDDVFNEVGVGKPNDNKTLQRQSADVVAKTSTPIRGSPGKKSLHLKKRQLNCQSSTKENLKPPSMKSDSANPVEGDFPDSDSCLNFLTRFESSAKKKKPLSRKKNSPMRQKTGTKLLFATNEMKNSDFPTNAGSEPHSIKEATVVQKSAPEDVQMNNESISDEIISQLIMDDSWTVKVTGSYDVRERTSIHNEVAGLDNVVTQVLLDDDNWSDALTNQSASKNQPRQFPNVSKTNQPSNEPLNRASKTLTVSCNSSSDELEATLPVPVEHAKSCPATTSDAGKRSFSGHNTPNASRFHFQAKKSAFLPTNAAPPQTHQICSAAEIEQKRLRALQRKRQRIH